MEPSSDESTSEAVVPGSEAEHNQREARRIAEYQESFDRKHPDLDRDVSPHSDAAPVEIAQPESPDAEPVSEPQPEFDPPVVDSAPADDSQGVNPSDGFTPTVDDVQQSGTSEAPQPVEQHTSDVASQVQEANEGQTPSE